MTTQPDIPSMNREQLIEYIENMGTMYASDDTTPLHAAAAMVAGYADKSVRDFWMTNELTKVKQELIAAKMKLSEVIK